MNFVGVGQILPLVIQVGDGSTNLFVRAKVYDDQGLAIGTFALTHVANGLYKSTIAQMPNVPWVTVQGEAYTDSGYTMPSDDYIDAQVFTSKEVDGGGLDINDIVSLVAQLGDGSTGLFPLATVYDDTFTPVGSPVALGEVGNGLYQDDSFRMPEAQFIVYQVQFFTDADHTMAADQLLASTVVMSSGIIEDNLPVCPDDLQITVAGFKTYFFRDFPYGNTTMTVMDVDIRNALIQATCFLNKSLFCSTGTYNLNILLLAAHFLVMSLRASAQGISGTFAWMTTSKSVGSVSESYQIPDRIMENPEFAMLTKTTYGAQFLFNILPELTGQIFVVAGRTLP